MLLDINKYILDNELKFITTSNIFIKDKYDPNGLFSNIIFGIQGSKKWRNTFAAITLNCRILHPVLFDIANRRCSHFMKLFTGEASLVKNGNTYTYVLGDEGEWGIDFFINNFNQIISALAAIPGLTDNGKRLLRYIANHQEVSFINNMLVIPPLFRPAFMKGMEVEVHPINDIYTELIRDAQLIKTTPMSNARKKILVKLQTSSYKIYKELQDWIKGKFGLTRTSILGKTLDFSGRAVITGDTEIDSDQIGVPFKMAVVLFAPFVIYKATHSYKSRFDALGIVPAIMNINKIIKDIQEGSVDISKDVVDIMIDICKEICSEKIVIAKRDPSLFRLSVRAYKPVIVFDSTIHINPLVTTGHGADFDGDQMAIIVPITDAAQQEARDTMLVQNNMFSPNGKLSMEFNNDFILGVYLLSKEPVTLSTIPNVSDIDSMLSLLYSGFLPNGVVSYKGKNISLGRLIISHYVGIPINEVLPSKKLKPIINSMPDRFPNSNDIVKNLNALMRCAGKVPTLIGKPLSAMEFSPSDELMAKIKQSTEDKTLGAKIPEYTQEFLNNKRDSDSLISDLIDSGSRGNATQIQQTSIAKGYISDMSGKQLKNQLLEI